MRLLTNFELSFKYYFITKKFFRSLLKMSDRAWWKEMVVYQIYPRSFYDTNGDGIGDLKGVTLKLPYLKSLGIEALWLSPYFKSPNCDNGYDISDYREIMEDFGTMDDWKEMIHEMHANGIKLIMDLVVNHTSDEHPWFIESRQSKDDKRHDYYIWRDPKPADSTNSSLPDSKRPPNNWTSCFGGSAWQYDEKIGQFYLHLFAIKQPDLNWECEAMRHEIHDMMKFWLDLGVDGFRLDAIANISKTQTFLDGDPNLGFVGNEHFVNGPRVHEFIHELNTEVFSKYDIMTVGECFSTNIDEAMKYVDPKRKELNMIFQFNLMDIDASSAGKWRVRDWKFTEFKDIIRRWQNIIETENGWNSIFLSNHDFPRQVSRFGDDSTPEFRVLSAKMLATMNFTLKGTVYVYQGEEIGMTNVKFDSIDDYKDIETINFFKSTSDPNERLMRMSKEEAMQAIHHVSRDNSRTPMQWDNTENAGFIKDHKKVEPWIKVNPNYTEINVEHDLNDKDSILNYYKALIQMRKDYVDVAVYGVFKDFFVEDENTYIYTRTYESKVMFIALNLTKQEQKLTVPDHLNLGEFKLVISNYSNENTDFSKKTSLRPFESIVLIH